MRLAREKQDFQNKLLTNRCKPSSPTPILRPLTREDYSKVKRFFPKKLQQDDNPAASCQERPNKVVTILATTCYFGKSFQKPNVISPKKL